MIRDVHPGSLIRIFSHPGSWIQGSKKHRIPYLDPQHCAEDYLVFFALMFSLIDHVFVFSRVCGEQDDPAADQHGKSHRLHRAPILSG
jgi:hypothetical protein